MFSNGTSHHADPKGVCVCVQALFYVDPTFENLYKLYNPPVLICLQVENLHLDVEQLQAVEQELRTRLAEQEALLQTHLDRTTVQSISTSSESEEMAALTEELATLKMDLVG